MTKTTESLLNSSKRSPIAQVILRRMTGIGGEVKSMPLPSRGAWAAIGVIRAAERSFTMAVGMRGHLQMQTRQHLRRRLMAAERPRRAIRVFLMGGQMRHLDKQTRDGLEKQHVIRLNVETNHVPAS